jgi:hypothetical protein
LVRPCITSVSDAAAKTVMLPVSRAFAVTGAARSSRTAMAALSQEVGNII